MEEERRNKLINRAFENLARSDYEKAGRDFKKAKCHGGMALVAFLTLRFERGVNQAFKSLSAGENCFPCEREVGLKILRLCAEKLGGVRVSEIEEKLSAVRWGEVEEKIAELADRVPSVFACLAPRKVSKEERDKKIAQAAAALRAGYHEHSIDILEELWHTCPDDEFLSFGWVISPHLIDEMRKELGGKLFRERARVLLEVSKKPIESKETGLLLGFWLLNFSILFAEASEFQNGEIFLNEALRCFDETEELGEKSSFFFFFFGIIHEKLKNYKKAIGYYKRSNQAPVVGLQCSTCGERIEPVSIEVRGRKIPVWHRMAELRAEACRVAMRFDFLDRTYRKLVKRSEKARGLGRVERELRLLEAALEICPGRFDSLAPRIAELRITLKRRVGLGFLQHALEVNPKNEPVLNHVLRRGTSALKRKDYRRAVSYFKMVPPNFDDPQFLIKYAEALKGVGEYKRALRVYKKLAGKDPHTLYQVAECAFLAKEWSVVTKNLEELLKLCDEPKLLEIGLKLAIGVGRETLVTRFCERLLAADPENRLAKPILERIRSAEMDKLRSEQAVLKARAMELSARGDHRGVLAQLSRVREEFMDQPSVELMARSLEKLGRYRDCIGWYSKLPMNAETLASMMFGYLMEGDFEGASELCKKFFELGEVKVLLEQIPYPDVRGFVLDGLGRYGDALKEYREEGLLLNFCERMREVGAIFLEIEGYKKLYEISRKDLYKQKVQELVGKNEEKLTVRFKSMVGFEGLEMVVCDTNVFFSKLIEELELPQPIRGLAREGVVRRFDEFSSQGKRIVLCEVVQRELDSLCHGLFGKLEPRLKEQAFQKLWEYKKKYKIEIQGEKGDWLKKSMKFYQRYPEKLEEITKKKLEVAPDERPHLLRKRTPPQIDSRLWDLGFGFQSMPEKADMELLAECLRLNNSCIPGVSRISLFSEDADFKEFTGEIFREFGIKVYS